MGTQLNTVPHGAFKHTKSHAHAMTCVRATLAVSATATSQLSVIGSSHTMPEETVTVDTTVAMADACEVGVGLWVGAIVGTLDGIAVG